MDSQICAMQRVQVNGTAAYICSARNVVPAPRVNQEYDSLRNQTLLHVQGIHLNTKELIRHIQTVKVHI